jgi:hypothetical protein
MPETKTVVFSYKEVAEALIHKTDIHEGFWGVYFEFGLAGANVGSGPPGPNKEDVRPAAIVPILNIGIQRFDNPSNLTVDASKVNPEKPKKK